MKKLFIILAVLATIAPPATARAGTSTGTLGVQMTLAGTCAVQNTTLNFGLQVNTFAAISGIGSVDVICSSGTSYSVDLDGGLHQTANIRRMYFNSGGAGPLAVDNFYGYNLYKDAAHTSVWGSCCSGSAITGFTGNGMVQHQPVYGSTYTVSGFSVPGIYTDTVTVTVTF